MAGDQQAVTQRHTALLLRSLGSSEGGWWLTVSDHREEALTWHRAGRVATVRSGCKGRTSSVRGRWVSRVGREKGRGRNTVTDS